MQHPEKITDYRRKIFMLPAFLVLGLLILSLTGCCGGYDYSTYRSQAEYALAKQNFKKAKELYSMIFNQESKLDPVDLEKITWAFYRLGVIAEVTGDVRMALGYYWGDKIDEGYYQKYARLDWLAQQGWNWLDAGNAPRSIETILDLEENGRQPQEAISERRKKEIVVNRERERYDRPNVSKDNRPRATFNRSLTPPPPNAPGPFRVFH
ncbi:MAG: hypothetical protein A2W80_02955 [Candidatus Riflebacteria bacterium GWC2_50_8]|nr:MAG: hypothetical protein A2W80_02955 [Candidatus Riflebacteria bacterium GWC2_50_8]